MIPLSGATTVVAIEADIKSGWIVLEYVSYEKIFESEQALGRRILSSQSTVYSLRGKLIDLRVADGALKNVSIGSCSGQKRGPHQEN